MSKENLLVIAAQIRSHIIPSIYLCKLLEDKYDIHYTVSTSVLQDIVTNHNYSSIYLEHYLPYSNVEMGFLKSTKSNFLNILKLVISDELYKEREKKLTQIVENLSPSCVIIDIFSSLDYLIFRKYSKDIKILFFNPMLSNYTIKGYPTINHDGWYKQELSNTIKQKNLISSLLKFPRETILSNLTKFMCKRRFRLSGFIEKSSFEDNRHAYLFKNIPEILLAPLELEVSTSIKQNWQHYLGLCTFKERFDSELDMNFYSKWEKILNKKREHNIKIVFCSFGTFYNGSDRPLFLFIRKIISIISNFENLELIIVASRFIEETIKTLSIFSNRIHFFSRVPQLRVLSESDLFVTHGGLGSIKEAIEFEVPMLVCPLDLRYDQVGNSFKIEYHNLGLKGSFENETETSLKGKINILLNEKKYKENIKEFKFRINKGLSDRDTLKTIQKLL